jgi:formaldehyde-activating enzyme involved in methanogenesis
MLRHLAFSVAIHTALMIPDRHGAVNVTFANALSSAQSVLLFGAQGLFSLLA